ncbi:Uncharacterized protein BM_BM1178 [Brugia malayi]|uniref:Bm1178, isoform a n=1 Tax=Brugia malayi TaxID=6279 RepID=A0A1P6BJB1_BRUMA|nr:Uncharacterized protein BM_BM1178 [Brugia malayi]CDQ03469.1 Bm1178, isoform a [Brugia malayi]VIO88510.1 Uncharacterized protein BM_BM1178 [Brugia malayi]
MNSKLYRDAKSTNAGIFPEAEQRFPSSLGTKIINDKSNQISATNYPIEFDKIN